MSKGTRNAPKWHQSCQSGATTLQRTPLELHRSHEERPKGSKGHPRGSQLPPRNPIRSQKGSKGAPKVNQISTKGARRDPHETLLFTVFGPHWASRAPWNEALESLGSAREAHEQTLESLEGVPGSPRKPMGPPGPPALPWRSGGPGRLWGPEACLYVDILTS